MFFTCLISVLVFCCLSLTLIATSEIKRLHQSLLSLQKKHFVLEEAFKSKPSEDFYYTIQRRFDETVQREHRYFEKELQKLYEKACSEIKFDEIQYKKVITTKRKDFARKNKPTNDSIKIWRDIFDE